MTDRRAGGRPQRTRLDIAVACFAIAAIVTHDAAHVSAGRAYDAFWVCNLSAAVLGPAIVLRSGSLVFAAFAWLLPGTIVWLLDAAVAGSSILPTSYAVHLGGTAAAAYGIRRFGYSRRGPLVAIAVLVFAVAVSRFLLPVDANVNAAHAIPRGWSFLATGRTGFVAISMALVGLLLAATALVARWIERAGR